MSYPDEDLNRATDARTNQHVVAVDIAVQTVDDLAKLRARWAEMDDIPKAIESRDSGEDNSFLGFDVRTLLRGEESSGRFCFHSIILPPGAEIPAHGHATGDTYWFVLGGEVELTIGSVTETISGRGFGFAPEQTTQALANRSNAPAEVYVGHSPAGADHAFAAAHRLAQTGETRPDAYWRIFSQHGFDFTQGAPLANDGRTNREAPRIDGPVNSLEDYLALRDHWRQLTPTPRLVTATVDCRNIPVADQETRVMLSPEESRASASVFFCGIDKGMGAPEHHQPTEEELFIVLDGPVQMNIGNSAFEAQRGAFGFAPRFGSHAFVNPIEDRAYLFTINAPGGHDRGFELSLRQLDGEQFGSLITAHGFQFHQAF